MDPLDYFTSCFREELSLSTARIPTACCFTTLGEDGFPNARFVSFKELVEGKFVVTGPLNSRKGSEVSASDKVALTFWWTETGRQVRIQGRASRLTEARADTYFSERNRESQIVSLVSEQGRELHDREQLAGDYEALEKVYEGRELPRPVHWGGFFITPQRIEFLEFKATRFHERLLFERQADGWKLSYLQP